MFPLSQAVKYLLERQLSALPEQRFLVLQTLSLLNSALPESKFLSTDLFTNLLSSFMKPKEEALPAYKKISEASILSSASGYRGSSPKASVVSAASSLAATRILGCAEDDAESLHFLQEILSLMLRVGFNDTIIKPYSGGTVLHG